MRKFFKYIGPARKRVLYHLPQNTIGAEIGTWEGYYAMRILNIVKPKKLFLIDPWRFLPEYPYMWVGGKIAKSQEDMDAVYNEVKKKFSSFNNVEIIRKDSEIALSQFEDESLDWVYIDGNHEYEFVLSDLRLSAKKVVKNGYITGDDYLFNSPNSQHPVQKAIETFLSENPEFYLKTIKKHQFIIRRKAE